MSMVRSDYVIIGYDLSELRDELMTEEWCENPDNEKWQCYQRKGEIQLFDDPCSSSHLFFGYIVSANDEYEDETTKISLADMERQKRYVDYKLWHETGLNIPKDYQPNYIVISFCEYR